MNNELSPVVIFTYNRINTLRLTIEALKQNTYAENSDLIIFSDGGITSDDQLKVDIVRKFLKSIKGFKSIQLIERNKNLGLAKNIVDGVSEIINKYGKVIVLEDDIITSKSFLCYMNKALDHYFYRDEIFSISGYTDDLPSLDQLVEDSYLSYRPSSWGWATWKKEWNNIDWNAYDYFNFINNKHEIKRFNRGGADMTKMLKDSMEGKNNSWAIRFAFSMFKQNKFCIFPKTSKASNIGYGEDATHCTGVNIHKSTLEKNFLDIFNFNDELKPNDKIAKEFAFQYSYKYKLLSKLRNIFNFKDT